MTYEPIKDKDGNIDWEAERIRRGNSVPPTPQPVPNRPATSQPRPVESKPETVDERIQRAQAWNMAVSMVPEELKKSIFQELGDLKEFSWALGMIDKLQAHFHEKLKNKC